MLRSATRYIFTSSACWASCRAMATTTSSTGDTIGMKGPVRASVAQLTSTCDKMRNLLDVARCAGVANRDGAKMLFLPECFGFIGESSEQTLRQAEPPIQTDESTNNDAVSNSLKQAVAEACETGICQPSAASSPNDQCSNENISLLHGLKIIAISSSLWISAGGMHECGAPPRDDDTDQRANRVYNTHVILDSFGNLQCLYRKIHLFDVCIPNKVNLRESATTAPGNKLVVCNSPIGPLGVTTCYDVRFPEMYIQIVRQGGAQVLLVPSAFTIPTGRSHWHTLLKARAIENQCYVIAAAQYGRHNEKRESYGNSLAVDPWGEVIGDAGGYDSSRTLTETSHVVTPNIITFEIDLDNVASVRQRMPIQQHRGQCNFSF